MMADSYIRNELIRLEGGGRGGPRRVDEVPVLTIETDPYKLERRLVVTMERSRRGSNPITKASRGGRVSELGLQYLV